MRRNASIMKNTLDYVEILTVNKIDNEAFSNVPNNSETKSTLKSYPHIYFICFQYLLTGISSSNTGFPTNLA